MVQPAQVVRYIADGNYSVEQARAALEAHGVLVRHATGEYKFVPDDPSFPTTLFRLDGQVELQLDTADAPRVEAYLAELSSCLRVQLQPTNATS